MGSTRPNLGMGLITCCHEPHNLSRTEDVHLFSVVTLILHQNLGGHVAHSTRITRVDHRLQLLLCDLFIECKGWSRVSGGARAGPQQASAHHPGWFGPHDFAHSEVCQLQRLQVPCQYKVARFAVSVKDDGVAVVEEL